MSNEKTLVPVNKYLTFLLFSTDWILKLGPKEETFPSVPQYQYSVVSTPRRGQLFVLARNPQDFNARFNKEVLSFLEQANFTRFLNEPIRTYQGPDCKYVGINNQEKMRK